MERRVVIFRGRVQGVGFRMTVRGLAAGRPLSGWVRNEPDGSVRAEIQGEAGAIDALLGSIGERMGRNIESVESQSAPPAAGEREFEIRRHA